MTEQPIWTGYKMPERYGGNYVIQCQAGTYQRSIKLPDIEPQSLEAAIAHIKNGLAERGLAFK